eukprot:UN09371
MANWEPMDTVPKLLNIDGSMTVLPPEAQAILPRIDQEDYQEAWRNYSGGLGETIQAVTASTQLDGLYATQSSSGLMGDESESEHFTAQTDSDQDSDEEEEEESEQDSDEEEEEEEEEDEQEEEEEGNNRRRRS